MIDFDLARAKAGEPIEYNIRECQGWIPSHFIGLDLDSGIVVRPSGYQIMITSASNLRMAPKPPKTMWVQCCRDMGGNVYCSNPKDSPQEAMSCTTLASRIGEPQPIQVPQ